jgi:high affinity sulfate transporter 1
MAYAEVAGLPPVVGLYALLLPSIAYALFGSSRQVIVGPEGALATLVAAAVLPLAAEGSEASATLAAMLALMVGGIFLLARALRLGWIADYLSRAVLVGYIHGIAIVLVIGQLGKLLGLKIEALDPIPQLIEVAGELSDYNAATVAISAASLVALLGLRKLAPRFPAALLVVGAGIVASSALSLSDYGVAVVGSVPSGLPSIGLELVSWRQFVDLLPAAFGIFFVALADGILTARAFAGSRGGRVDASQEILALGVANVAAGFSQGMAVGVSGSRTAANDSSGGRSQFAGLFAACAVAVVLLLLTGPIADMPKAVLGAAIVAAAIGLVDPAAWRALRVTDRVEFWIAAITAIAVVVTGVLGAIGLAIALTVIDVVRRSATPHDAVLGWVPRLGRYGDISIHRRAELVDHVVVYRLDDRLFFANCGYVEGRIREAIRGAPTKTELLIFDAESLAHVDAAGAEMLTKLAKALSDDGIKLVFARMRPHIREKLDSFAPGWLPPERSHPTVRAAVDSECGRSEDAAR